MPFEYPFVPAMYDLQRSQWVRRHVELETYPMARMQWIFKPMPLAVLEIMVHCLRVSYAQSILPAQRAHTPAGHIRPHSVNDAGRSC